MIGAAYADSRVGHTDAIILRCNFADPAGHRAHEPAKQGIDRAILLVAVGNIVVETQAGVGANGDEATVIHDDMDLAILPGGDDIAFVDPHLLANRPHVTRDIDNRRGTAGEGNRAGGKNLSAGEQEKH